MAEGGDRWKQRRANSGEVIDIRTPESATVAAGVQLAPTPVKTPAMEVKRLTPSPKGREIPAHQAPGEITVECLQGRVAFTAGATTVELGAGRMLFLDVGTPHSLVGLEDSTLLVTKLVPAPAPESPVPRYAPSACKKTHRQFKDQRRPSWLGQLISRGFRPSPVRAENPASSGRSPTTGALPGGLP